MKCTFSVIKPLTRNGSWWPKSYIKVFERLWGIFSVIGRKQYYSFRRFYSASAIVKKTKGLPTFVARHNTTFITNIEYSLHSTRTSNKKYNIAFWNAWSSQHRRHRKSYYNINIIIEIIIYERTYSSYSGFCV